MAWEASVTKIKELGATMSDVGGRLVNFENFFWGRKEKKKDSIFLNRSTEAGGPKGVMPQTVVLPRRQQTIQGV